MNTRRRALAVLAAGAMLVPVVAAGSASAAPGDAIPPAQQPLEGYCVNVLQTEPFTDILGTTFERAIECLAASKITQGGPNGISPSLYGPDLTVQRDSMATFIARLMDKAAELGGDAVRTLPAYDGTPAFTDVPRGNIHEAAINRLEQAGVVEGGVANRPRTLYSPKDQVTRGQMASFLNRAYDFLTGAPLRTDNDYFTDDETSVHEANINGVASEGIAVGDGRDSYRPSENVLRGQMAGFLVRLLGVLEEQGFIAALPPDSSALRAAVNADGVQKHLQAFQDIADANDGNRASGTPGYDKSVDYVVDELTSYGYEVSTQTFDFPFFRVVEEARLATEGATTPIETGTFVYSGSGDIQNAPIEDVDYRQPTPDDGDGNISTAGCEASDFAGFPAGAVALIQRGTCTFAAKAMNAQDAGASAVIIYNEGQEGRQGLVVGTLGGPGVTIPVVGASFQDGRALAEGGDQVEVFTKTESEIRQTENVIAESKTGDDSNVVMMGAHVDGVLEGVGMNDNGSGAAGLLEVAKQAASIKPTNTLRFAFWGAEELGLLGAENYVAELSQQEVDNIALYLNYDMIGSSNFVRFVYDGDGSASDGAGPQGSAAIEYMFADYFESQGLASDPTEFNGRSDYGPFIAEGIDIPSGGLFTGAEGVKTEEQAAVYGGEAGVAYDPCYHADCDDIDNVSLEVIGQNVDAMAHALVVFGASTRGAYDLGQPNRTSGPGTSTGGGGSQGGLRDSPHQNG